jgi:hypothetical protein
MFLFVPIVENGVFFVTHVSLFHYVFLTSRVPPTITNQVFLFPFVFILSWLVVSSIPSTIILKSRILLEFEQEREREKRKRG